MLWSVALLALGIGGASATPLSCESQTKRLLNIAQLSTEYNKKFDQGEVVVEGYAEKADKRQHAFYMRVRIRGIRAVYTSASAIVARRYCNDVKFFCVASCTLSRALPRWPCGRRTSRAPRMLAVRSLAA
jgi:hypothetical protein